jgi:hypothetical protein
MKKSIITLVLSFILIFSLAFSGSAAPDYINGNDASTSYSLITITNPDKVYSSTYNKAYTISGFANSGATVYVYIGDGVNYRPYYENGGQLSTTAGASGLFVINVNLSNGRNNFLLRAENGGEFQNTKFQVNLLSSSMLNLIDSLKGFKFNLFQ